MKRLLWSASLACFLPIVAEMPSQAAGNFDVVAEPSTKLANIQADGFGDDAANLVNPFASTASFAPAQKIATVDSFDIPNQSAVLLEPSAAPDSLENPFAPTRIAVQPTKRKAKQPTALKSAPASTQLQPVKADNSNILAQNSPTTTDLDRRLGDLNNQKFPVGGQGSQNFGLSPALSINNPVGFGADGGVGFLSGSYQSRTRGSQTSDGELGIGVGLFDAVEAVGLEVSYTINSFGRSQNFGNGGFNAKLHKRFGDAAVAVGWNRFANISFGGGAVNNNGNTSDFSNNSYYAVATQVLRTTEDIDSFLSRISLSAGVGGGQFLSSSTTSTNLNAGGVNVFGSAAFRLAKPISAIVEWTGQDLAAGLSLTPFGDGFPLVITPAFRDITGVSGESARFVLGVGTAFKF
jgi:hypothetical protein